MMMDDGMPLLPRALSLLFARRGFAQDRFHRREQRFRLQHHSFAAAEGTIIHRFVAIVSELSQVVHVDIDQARFACAANNSIVQGPGEEFRENRNDIELHVSGN